MKRLKLLIMAVFMGLLCTSAALATSYYGWQGNWNNLSDWRLWTGSSYVIPGTLPGSGDDIYTQFTSPTSRQVLQSGSVATVNSIYLGLYDDQPGGGIEVSGTLTSALGLFYGNWFSISTPTTPSLFWVKDGANVTLNNYGIYAVTYGSTVTQDIIVDGGQLTVASITLNPSTPIRISLNGGTMTVTGSVTGTNMILDIAGGTLKIGSSVFNSLVTNGNIIQANGNAVNSGNVNALLNVDSVTSPGNVLVISKVIPLPGAASSPLPAHGATSVSITADLSWTAGSDAASHNVYFGADSTPDAGESKGNQPGTSYDPGTLAYETTYYWRIDEVNPAGTTTGTVWSFTTEPMPVTAFNPLPANGATSVSITSDLGWTAGQYALCHDVYFGTSPSAVAGAQQLLGDINGDGPADTLDLGVLAEQWLTNPGSVHPSADIVFNSMVDIEDFAALTADWGLIPDAAFKGSQTVTTFDPGTLTGNTTYYWRIDEVDPSHPDSPWTGPVWSFTTEAAIPPAAATNPSPANGAMGVSVDANLSWTAGAGAVTHKLYGGTTTPPAYVTDLTSTTFEPALVYNTTYYWRIDEVNEYGTTIGTVWTFTTASDRLTPEQFVILPWDSPWRWWGPAFSTSVLSEVRDCGFNIGGFLSPGELNYAASAGIKGIVFYDPYPYGLYCHVYGAGEGASVDMTNLTQEQVDSRATTMINWVGSHSALFGYYLRDEPGANLYPVLGKFVDAFHRLDSNPNHRSLINLFPNYASSTQMQVSNYNTYVNNFMSTVQPDYVCYDNYTFYNSPNTYWSNLETIRSYARTYGKPFWNVVACAKWSGCTYTPTAASSRFQLYTSLAYGAKGISWFPYFLWPAEYGYSNAPIDANGNKTETWYYLQDVNMQMHRIGPTYITLTHANVFHTGTIPSGGRNISSSWYVQSASSNLVIGEFYDASSVPYLMVVNKSLTSNTSLTVTPKAAYQGAIYRVNSSTGQLELFTQSQTLLPGEGMLLKLVH